MAKRYKKYRGFSYHAIEALEKKGLFFIPIRELINAMKNGTAKYELTYEDRYAIKYSKSDKCGIYILTNNLKTVISVVTPEEYKNQCWNKYGIHQTILVD